eukprot:jgi/Botrbrau1/22608/Bobra.176_1s0038.1
MVSSGQQRLEFIVFAMFHVCKLAGVFTGIDWEHVRDGRAPAFLPAPPRDPHADAMDWELRSLMASVPQNNEARIDGRRSKGSSDRADGGCDEEGSAAAGKVGVGAFVAEAAHGEEVAAAVASLLLQQDLNWSSASQP